MRHLVALAEDKCDSAGAQEEDVSRLPRIEESLKLNHNRKLEYRAPTPADCDGYTKLFSNLWSWESPAEHYYHKFFANPAGAALAAIAVDTLTGEIVGSLACIPARYRLAGADVMATQSGDVGVLPEYRKRGTYWKVYKPVEAAHIERAVTFTHTVAMPAAEKIATRMQHFDPLCRVPIFSRHITVRSLLPPAVRSLMRVQTEAGFYGKIRAARHCAAARRICEREGLRLEKIREPDERFDLLWQQSRDQWPIALIRDRQFLTWRFASHPVRHYSFLTVSKGETLLGYCVIDVLRRDGVSRGRLSDLLVHPDHPVAGQALLHQAASDLIRQGADMLVGWFLPLDLWGPLLRTIGMRHQPRDERNIIVRVFMEAEESHSELLNPDCWYYTGGADTDQL